MALQKLSAEVQSLLTSSIKVNYKRAVEELVYNALDAQSTSVAIRINLQEKKIQVIDNGVGLSRSDLSLVGQKHVTSKFKSEETLKSVPQMFGYKGQSLASIIEVSRNVKITSRKEVTEDTWVKSFYKGSETSTCQTEVRPSKGTTVEINGLLYNLPIQEKILNILSELQDIKSFLKQVSLAHSNVSISLRDDSKNEIVFKVHKNRDIYQTFQSLFDIERKDVQELKVEKNQYKVVAYIGKTDTEINDHWIYLNKRYIGDSKLHTKVNECMSKYLRQKQPKDKSKLKQNFENKEPSKSNIPFYYIFVTCPYSDYDVNYVSKMAKVEFKSWDQMDKLIEKLVSFYTGNRKDLKIVSEIKTVTKGTKEQVKQIINKIMSSNSKIIDVSKMHKGIKGKDIKRKKRKIKEDKTTKSSKSKIKQDEVKKSKFELKNDMKEIVTNIENSALHTPVFNHEEERNIKKTTVVSKKIKKKRVKESSKNHGKKNKLNIIKDNKKQQYRDPVIEKFENGTESIKKRFESLAKHVNNLINKYNHTKNEIKVSEVIESNNFISNNRNISIRKRVNEVVIHKYIPLPPPNKKKYSNNVNNLPRSSTYDLVQTIEKFQHLREDIGPTTMKINDIIYPQFSNSETNINNINDNEENILNLYLQQSPKLTYDSHKNCKTRNFHTPNKYKNGTKFITKASKQNFEREHKKENTITKVKCGKIFKVVTRHKKDRRRNINPLLKPSIFHEIDASYNYLIECSESNESVKKTYEDETQIFKRHSKDLNKTYSIVNNDINVVQAKGNTSASNNDVIYCNDNDEDQEIANKNYLSADNDSVVFVTRSQPKNQNNNSVNEKGYPRNNIKDNNLFILSDSGPLENDMETSDMHHEISFYSKEKNSPSKIQKSRTIYSHEVSGEIENKENDFGKETSKSHKILSQTTNVNNELMKSKIIELNNDTINKINVNTDKGNNFTFNKRMRFLPKGMSQIFANCNSKTVCDYKIDEEYFGNTLYNNFINDVELNAQVFKPNMQNVNEYTTKDIEKVNRRLNKDNSSLVFDSRSLKEAKVLRQVDEKFIAAMISGQVKQTKESCNVLVLFDQHAVHERIRLEDNLSEYLFENDWQSIGLESTMTLKLSKENMLYLHNYSKKFKQFGLDWTVLDEELLQINAIPEAILGKNTRSPETILKSVKNLIIEEIVAIHSQNGCISLYPKSIMDLVCSEACRYAIKFGDRLSKSVCAGLILSLSDCKTPFQCAHGRPVMAVIMDLQEVEQEYRVNMDSVRKYWNQRSNINC